MIEKRPPKKEQRVDDLLEKNRSARREILKDIPDIPHIHERDESPLEHVVHGHNVDVKKFKKKRGEFEERE